MSLHEKDQNQHLEHVPLQFPEHVMTNESPGGAQRGGGGRVKDQKLGGNVGMTCRMKFNK